jgi:hypothetical protein
MKDRGNSYPRYFGREVFLHWVVLFFIFCILNFKPAFAQEMPVLHGVSPEEGFIGEGLSLVLDGDGFSQLHNLTNINISAVQIPFSNYEIIDNQTITVSLRIPEQCPTGKQQISFIFDNGFRLEAPFVILESAEPSQEPPFLNGVSPQEGRPGEQLPITLDGGGFSRLGALQAVNIRGVDAPILDYNLTSDETIEVLVGVPDDTPPGEGNISFSFENGHLDTYFVVTQPGAPPPEEPASASIQEISPQEGRAGSELSLRMSGENLSQLGNLQSVDINGRDVPVMNYQILSDQAVETLLTIPADIPTGDGQISIFFDNSTFEAPFTMLAAGQLHGFPSDVIIVAILIFGVIGFIGTIGFVGRRLFSRQKPQTKSSPQQPVPTPPEIYFKTRLEPGSQTIQMTNIKADIDIRLITTIAYGVQYVEMEQDALIDE